MIPIPASASSDVQQAFRAVDRSLARLIGDQNVDFAGRRIINAGQATQPFDYVRKAELDAAIAGVGHDVDPPVRLNQMVMVGTHAERLVKPAGGYTLGTLFYETDRAAFYQVQLVSAVRAWVLAMCRPLRTSDSEPGDLGTNDVGFTWFDQVDGVTLRWSGGAWNYYLGSYVNTFANRPDPALADRGFLFIASDRGDHVWRKTGDVWVLVEGMGGPTRGTLANITTSLGTDDEGYVYHATDFDRTYRWSGSAWADVPGGETRLQIVYFNTSPAAWWALCDGSTVTRSTGVGGSTSYVTPNLTTGNRFIRSSTSAGTTGGSATTHTHPIDPPSTTSGAISNNVAVQSGAGTVVAADPHTHAVDIASFASGTPSGTSGDDALPPYMNLMPYVRL